MSSSILGIRKVVLSQEKLATSEDIFGVFRGVWMLLASSGLEARAAAKHPRMQTSSHNKELASPKQQYC